MKDTDITCDADKFFSVVQEEVSEQIKERVFTKAALRNALTSKQWEEIYNKHKVVIFSCKKSLSLDLNKTRRGLDLIERGLLRFPLEELNDHPHHSIVNKWLKEKLGIVWVNIPLKIQRKDTMKTELLRFIKERLNVTVSNDRELYQLEMMLIDFEQECKKMNEKKEIAALEKRIQDRLRRKKILLAEKERLRARYELRALQLHYVKEERAALIDDLQKLLFP